jgi:hypothetical protein
MGSNSSQTSTVKYTGGVRDLNSGEIKRYSSPKDAYNSLYNDVHAKLNGHSSWVKPNTTISSYISKFAPKEDNNDPKSYTKHMVSYFNNILGKYGIVIDNDSTLSNIKGELVKHGFDPEHEFTKAHLKIEDPKTLKDLNIN